ncbi:hypothetical protein T09_5179 [Trichinella sp. T9]|nr:hypothetical protein T09_5179 [Trichinella sp. T9]
MNQTDGLPTKTLLLYLKETDISYIVVHCRKLIEKNFSLLITRINNHIYIYIYIINITYQGDVQSSVIPMWCKMTTFFIFTRVHAVHKHIFDHTEIG